MSLITVTRSIDQQYAWLQLIARQLNSFKSITVGISTFYLLLSYIPFLALYGSDRESEEFSLRYIGEYH